MTKAVKLGGIFGNVALLDIASMHPSSIEAMQLFGPKYTKRFSEIKQARIAIKHKDYDKVATLLNGALKDLIDVHEENSELAYALKIAINSVYGLTSAKFPNPFNDVAAGRNDRNKDNKVAKRGALFMIMLKHEVQRRGYTVVHIKTDSIKIADADQFIVDYVTETGKKYGYDFELEAVYDRLCIVNKSTYIAHAIYGDPHTEDHGWTATGLQFQVPYVFKTLFSGNPIEFRDLSETKSATSSLYLDFNEGLPEGEHKYSFVGKVSAFSPVKPGCGGGLLMRQQVDKMDHSKVTYAAAGGTKGWRWKESSILRDEHLEDQVDKSYYDKLVDDALKTINEYGDYDAFVDLKEPYISPNPDCNQFVNDILA